MKLDIFQQFREMEHPLNEGTVLLLKMQSGKEGIGARFKMQPTNLKFLAPNEARILLTLRTRS